MANWLGNLVTVSSFLSLIAVAGPAVTFAVYMVRVYICMYSLSSDTMCMFACYIWLTFTYPYVVYVTGDLSVGSTVHIPLHTGDAAPTRAGPNQVRET